MVDAHAGSRAAGSVQSVDRSLDVLEALARTRSRSGSPTWSS